MKTLKLDLNRLSREQLQAYLILAEFEVKDVQEQIKEENKEWMGDIPKFDDDDIKDESNDELIS